MGTDRAPLVLHVVRTLDGGGLERSLVSLLRTFRSPGLRHAVVTLRDTGSLSERLPDGVACYPIGASGRSWAAGIRLARVARAWNASVLHARGTGCWNDAIVAHVLGGCGRVVLGFHGLEASTTFGSRHRRSARCGLLVGARFASVFESGVQQLHDELGIPLSRIDLLKNGVCLRSFANTGAGTRQRIRKGLGFTEDAFVLGVVGSLSPVKRHDVLIGAIARLAANYAHLKLVIVGDGPLRTWLEHQARSAKVADRVRFAGWREDVPDLLASMDAYVCSSASEGMSNALLEAMAAGLPVIATDVGDNRAIVRDGVEGLIFEPESAEACANAIETLVVRPGLRKRLEQAARVRVSQYDLDRAAENYEAYYASLLSSPLRAPARTDCDSVCGVSLASPV